MKLLLLLLLLLPLTDSLILGHRLGHQSLLRYVLIPFFPSVSLLIPSELISKTKKEAARTSCHVRFPTQDIVLFLFLAVATISSEYR